MINSIMTSLMNVAFDNGYSVILESRFTPYTPSAANPFTKTIVINDNWHNPRQLPFQLAHELGHLLNKDENSACLYFSPTKSGIEGNANRTAIRLLLPYYLDNNESEHVSSVEFMESLGMSQYLEDMVQEEIINYYKSFD